MKPNFIYFMLSLIFRRSNRKVKKVLINLFQLGISFLYCLENLLHKIEILKKYWVEREKFMIIIAEYGSFRYLDRTNF